MSTKYNITTLGIHRGGEAVSEGIGEAMRDYEAAVQNIAWPENSGVISTEPDEEPIESPGLVVCDGETMNFDYAVEATICECSEDELIDLLLARFNRENEHETLEQFQAFCHRLQVRIDDELLRTDFTNEAERKGPRLCPVCGKERGDDE